jgi:hypothetical protein
MEISQYGEGSIFIKGKKESVWFNPRKGDIDGHTGEVRVVIFKDADTNFMGLNTGNKVVIWGPGEYEVAGVEILGVRLGTDGVMYIVQMEGIKVGWLSTLEAELTDKKKEKLNECDVLIVPSLGQIKEIWEKTKGLGESYLIITGLSIDNQKKLLDLADREDLVPIPTLLIEKENLPEVTEVVLLAAK